uniref:Uncharacterized protein n=1 Tax=Rangifer tarandus platyrhynchus TaxID=3082113 RepID=A0ACB0DX09_RANTA|nr:unnamed protein product [Rangifer tarandus platyrhynchus]
MNTQDVFLYFRACRFEAQTAATPPPAHRPPAAPCPEALCLMLTACPQPRPLPGGLAVPPFHSLLCLEPASGPGDLHAALCIDGCRQPDPVLECALQSTASSWLQNTGSAGKQKTSYS